MQCLGGLAPGRLYDGKYPPVLHIYWGDAKVWSNLLENSRELSQLARNTTVYRWLKPRSLCLLTENSFKHIEVAQWESETGETLSYVFVAYSGEHFDHRVYQDMVDLHNIGMVAARSIGVDAFWVSGSCMRNEAELENDVSTIRSALSFVDRFGG